MNMNNKPKPYGNPYLAGVFLGAVLLIAYVTLGAGLGASGGLARLSAFLEGIVASGHVQQSAYFGRWGSNPLKYYLVFMLIGTFCGGLISAAANGRFSLRVERGRRFSSWGRLALAGGGGILVGWASRLARGCTSGQALSGGAQLLTGSLVFLVCLFAAGYATAWLFRRQWRD